MQPPTHRARTQTEDNPPDYGHALLTWDETGQKTSVNGLGIVETWQVVVVKIAFLWSWIGGGRQYVEAALYQLPALTPSDLV